MSKSEWEFSGPNIYELFFGIVITFLIWFILSVIGKVLFGPPDPWVLWVLWFTVWGNVEVKANRRVS